MAVALSSLPLLAQTQAVVQPADSARQEVRDAYNTARHLNTIDAWDIFINNYPESLYIEQARKMRDAAIVNAYCNRDITLARLTSYIDDNTAHEPRIKTFYANLVNNPTHSYRYEHMDIGFNGCTGRVDEHIEWADTRKHARDNYFVFDDKGLLVTSAVMGSKGKVVHTTYAYTYDNLHGFGLKSSLSHRKETTYAAAYDASDKLASIKGENATWVYTYNDMGALSKLVSTSGATTRTLVYRDGYIIREETAGKVLRYLYDYDTATFKKYLIGINEMADGQAVHERKVEYDIDSKGRITRAVITQDGKPEMTITRRYSD